MKTLDNQNQAISEAVELDINHKVDVVEPELTRKVRYHYVISTITVTRRKRSRIFEFKATDGWFKRFSIGLPYSFLTLILGWWGLPFGLINTPTAILRNLLGGEDVTFEQSQELEKKYTNNQLSKESA